MRRQRAVPAALLVAALLVSGCRNEEVEALRAEIARLREERVERRAVDVAREETAAASAALDERTLQVESLREQLADREAERDRMLAAFQAAVARNASLVAGVEAAAAEAQAAAAEGQQLDAEIERARERARYVWSQSDVLARELRPGDPPWATERRVRALAEFLERVQQDHPDDPVVEALADDARALDPREPGVATDGAALAARLRERFAAVYELPPPDVEPR